MNHIAADPAILAAGARERNILIVSSSAHFLAHLYMLVFPSLALALRGAFDLPLAAYNVSGEYAAAKLLAREGLAPERDLVIENLTAIMRAGASIILTYHLRDVLRNRWL